MAEISNIPIGDQTVMSGIRDVRTGTFLFGVHIISALGLVAYVLTYTWAPPTTYWARAFATGFPVVAAIALVSYPVLFRDRAGRHLLLHTSGVGGAIGGFLVSTPGIGVVFQQAQIGSPVINPTILLTESAIGGILIGAAAGHFYGQFLIERKELAAQRDRLGQHKERLTVLNRILRHDIRNHMSVVLGNVTLLSDRHGKGELLENIESHGQKVVEISQNARQIETTLTEDVPSASVNLADLVRDGVKATTIDIEGEAVDIRLPEDVNVQSNGHLASAVRNVIENAFEHNDSQNPEVIITATVDADIGEVELRVADNGPGIPKRERKALDTGENQLQHSNGLGLWLTHWVIEDLGGQVTFQSRDPRGTVVTFTLPTVPASFETEAGSTSSRSHL